MTSSRTAVDGLIAGAVGTIVLNAATYLDISVRGRPPSSVPAETVDKLAESSGIQLSDDGNDSDTAKNRREGIGALFGYLTGIGFGVLYSALRSGPAKRAPIVAAGIGLGAAVMASTDLSYTRMGVSDPRTWGLSGWASDAIPHALYGVATAAAFDLIHGG